MNAHFKHSLSPHETRDVYPATDRMSDGSLVVSPEQLARFGNGDAAIGRKQLRKMLSAERQLEISAGRPTRPLSVRVAVEADEPAVLALLLQDLAENAAEVAEVSEDRVLDHIRLGTRRKGGVVGVIDGPDGKPIAVTIMISAQWWWSKQWFFQEIVNYVHPDHRKSRHFDEIIKFEKWWQDSMTRSFGYRVYLLCGVLATQRVWEKIAAYKRKFQQAGIFCIYPRPFSDGGA